MIPRLALEKTYDKRRVLLEGPLSNDLWTMMRETFQHFNNRDLD